MRPGAHLLAAPGAEAAAHQLTAASPLGVIQLGEFVAPPTAGLGPQALHAAATIALPATASGPALRLSLADFRPAPLLLSPRPYPGFLQLFFQSSAAPPALRLANVQVLQVLVESGAGKAVDVEAVGLE